MSYDPAVVREWLYQTLLASYPLVALVPGGIWRGTVPEGKPYPFISYHLQAAGQDTTSISRRRILSNGLWMVRATAIEGDSDVDLDTIASMIDDVLDRQGGLAASGRVYMATRETPWDRTYDEGGRTFVEAGGLYRIWVQDPAAA